MVTQVETPTELKLAILAQLKHGHENALTCNTLKVILGERDTRHIREELLNLVIDGHRIAALAKPPYGYFIADTPEECQEYLDFLLKYIINLAIHRKYFKRDARPIMQRGQLPLL